MGSRKAAVFPVPVAAVPTTSWPASAGGMACAWMGVGCSNPARSRAWRDSGESFRSANDFVVKGVRLLAPPRADEKVRSAPRVL